MQFTRPQLLLAVVSLLFLGATAFLMYVAVAIGGTLSRTKWTDLFYVVAASSSGYFLVYALVCTSVAVLASCFRRFLPPTNNWLMTFACMFVVFASVLAAMGYRSAAASDKWSASSFPFNAEETIVADTFHDAYCPTRYRCVASVESAINVTANATMSMCATKKPAPSIHIAVFQWVDTYCNMAADTDAYCKLLGRRNASNEYSAPYQRCRLTLFVEWSRYATNVAYGSTALALSALVYILVVSRSQRPAVARPPRSRKDNTAYVATVV
ncbi:hypothetical protein DYB30_010177 [Aphanomyces astaci]|uniref:Uncharacterized protein n=1 Tax=Aphanomyces astaci TaxID=112090 RepID=A0A397E9W2_APHAT|nr:hypothetical protein DYB30_010177 [Aphanomyces astaci]